MIVYVVIDPMVSAEASIMAVFSDHNKACQYSDALEPDRLCTIQRWLVDGTRED